MDENKDLQENTPETTKEENPILEYGSSIIQTSKGTVHVLTIVGQVEGHQVLPPSSKSTKYEHVMPLLAMVEESEAIDGLLVLLKDVYKRQLPVPHVLHVCRGQPLEDRGRQRQRNGAGRGEGNFLYD